jgi:hypothetical protein
MLPEKIRKAFLRSEVAEERAHFFQNESPGMYSVGLCVLRIDPIVADERVGQGDDLAAVGGRGENFLIADHVGLKNHFPGGFSGDSAGPPFEGSPVL